MKAFGVLAGLAIASSVLLVEVPAVACSVVYSPSDFTPAGRRQRARATLARADAVIDGEVVRPASAGTPALVYAHRVLRGPQQEWFLVEAKPDESCALDPGSVGTRMRMILARQPHRRDPDVFYLYADPENARYEDRILGSDRRREFPYFAGPR